MSTRVLTLTDRDGDRLTVNDEGGDLLVTSGGFYMTREHHAEIGALFRDEKSCDEADLDVPPVSLEDAIRVVERTFGPLTIIGASRG